MKLMTDLARLTEIERQRLLDEFLDAAFGSYRSSPDFIGVGRSLTPAMPDDPDQVQLTAWVRLAELLQDNSFRGTMRRLVEQHAADRAADGSMLRRDLAAAIRAWVEPALAAGVDPHSAAAEPVVTAIIDRYPADPGATITALGSLLDWLETVRDPRREQYLRLLSVINDWPPPESLAPVFDWTVAALQARRAG